MKRRKSVEDVVETLKPGETYTGRSVKHRLEASLWVHVGRQPDQDEIIKVDCHVNERNDQ